MPSRRQAAPPRRDPKDLRVDALCNTLLDIVDGHAPDDALTALVDTLAYCLASAARGDAGILETVLNGTLTGLPALTLHYFQDLLRNQDKEPNGHA